MKHRPPLRAEAGLLDTTRRLSGEEMAELQLELGETRRALEIYEGLLLERPRDAFYRRRCEWLARVVLASRTRCRPPRSRVTTRPGRAAPRCAAETPRVVRKLEIIAVGL